MTRRCAALAWAATSLVATASLGTAPAVGATPAGAPPETVYVGTVAGAEVVVRDLRSFAYLRRGFAIDLEERDGGWLVECPRIGMRGASCESPSGWWQVQAQGDAVAGSWRKTRDGAARPIELRRTARAYDEVLLAANRMATGKAKTTGSVRWAERLEQRSGIAWPLLLGGPDGSALEALNAEWSRRQADDIVSAFDGVDYEVDRKVVHADGRLVAIAGTASWSGGAHPSFGFSAWTWDLRSGRTVDWEALLRASPPGPVSLARRDGYPAIALREMTLGDPKRRKADNDDCIGRAVDILGCDDGRCNEVPRYEGRVGWPLYPTPAGLAVAPDVYSEAERGCRGETVVVPWAAVRRALKTPSDLLPR